MTLSTRTYCWQTRRVLAKYALSTFEVMKDGDIGKVQIAIVIMFL